MKNTFFVLLSLLFLCSCENDVDINAPAVETPIVYGFLDPNDTIQYIRISKTFQTTQQAVPSEAAKQKENLYLKDLKVTVKNKRTNAVYVFEPTNDIPKDPGFFGNEVNILYSDKMQMKGGPSRPAGNAFSNLYDLFELEIFSPATGKSYKATTSLVHDANLTYSGSPLYLYTYNNKGESKALPVSNSYSGMNGAIYDLAYRVYYTETTSSGTVLKYIDYTLPPSNFVIPNMRSGTQLNTSNYKSMDFLNYLRNNAPPIEPGVTRRFAKMEIAAYGGSSDLLDYYNLYRPSLSITQKKPVYSNISGALGIFSSRNRTSKLIKYGDPVGTPTADSTIYLISHFGRFVYP